MCITILSVLNREDTDKCTLTITYCSGVKCFQV